MPAPRADWTQEAGERIRQSYLARKQGRTQMADIQDDPQLVELNRLHEAVAASILVHHFNPNQGLRAKYGRLDWSLGPDAARLGEKTGADYALFTVVRDAYASGARQAVEVFNTAAMIALALTGRVIVTPSNSKVTRAHASPSISRPAASSGQTASPTVPATCAMPTPPRTRWRRCSRIFRSKAMRRRHFTLGFVCMTLASALWAADENWTPPPRLKRPDLASDEGGLWAQMERAEAKLKTSPFLIRDPALNDYVYGVACKLAAEHCPDIRVYVVRTPWFNASMAPNGMMQVWSAAHPHGERSAACGGAGPRDRALPRAALARALTTRAVDFTVAQFLGLGLTMGTGSVASGMLTQVAAVAGFMSYSRDQEREADRIGLETWRAPVTRPPKRPGCGAASWRKRKATLPAKRATWEEQRALCLPPGAGRTATDACRARPTASRRQQRRRPGLSRASCVGARGFPRR